jgi:3-oxoacyl-[acyl-carrier protein] reductase
MLNSLSGKIAVVTGGTRGIGFAIAARLLKEGVSVAICGRKRESVDRAVAALGSGSPVFGYPADVTDPAQVEKFFHEVEAHFGGIDILVNNAGEGVFKKVGEMTTADWHRNIDLNLNGAFYCARQALGSFRQRGGGFIVNISSLAARNAFSGGAGYNASKFGLNGFSEAMMLDHRHDGVRVSSIMPGSVATEFGGAAGKAEWKIAPEDVAEAVTLVLSMPERTTVSRVEIRPSRPPK